MPNEVENIILPYDKANEDILGEIDKRMRAGENIDEILKITDEIVLQRKYGLSRLDIKMANNIWKKLSSRRLNRGNNK